MTPSPLLLAAYAFLALGCANLLFRLYPLLPKNVKVPQMTFAQILALLGLLKTAVADLPALITEVKALIAEIRAIFPASTPAEIAAALAEYQKPTPPTV